MLNSLTVDKDGNQGLARKPTRFVSNSRYMIEELTRKCSRDHVHVPLEGGRAGPAAIYPLELLIAILKGIARTRDAISAVRGQQVEDYEVVLSLATAEADLHGKPDAGTEALPTTKIPIRKGGEFQLQFRIENFKQVYRDEYE